MKNRKIQMILRENVPPHEWNDWRWQIKNRIDDIVPLAELLHMPSAHLEKYRRVTDTYPFFLTPYYLSLVDVSDRKDPILMQCFPDPAELECAPMSTDDPLEEEKNMAVPGLIHRYPDRCLAMITSTCATYCRHCNRKRRWKEPRREHTWQYLQGMVDYVRRTSQIREVIISGGDPLMIDIEMLERFLHALRSIPHVEVLRIGSRVPVVVPMMINPELCDVLRKYRPLWFNTQFNHPREITADAAGACEMLLTAGIPVSNQSVLLKGINDTYGVMRDLLYGLQRISVRPYYLFQCEPVKGTDHFHVSKKRGITIMEKLWGTVSGLCIPRYVYDLPAGRGKIPLYP